VLICCAASAVDTELQHGLAAAVGDGGLPAVGAARGDLPRSLLGCVGHLGLLLGSLGSLARDACDLGCFFHCRCTSSGCHHPHHGRLEHPAAYRRKFRSLTAGSMLSCSWPAAPPELITPPPSAHLFAADRDFPLCRGADHLRGVTRAAQAAQESHQEVHRRASGVN